MCTPRINGWVNAGVPRRVPGLLHRRPAGTGPHPCLQRKRRDDPHGENTRTLFYIL